jgi:hypothetical protein
MGPSVDDVKYVLIVKDDYSNYVWLKQCKNADAYKTAAVLIEWFAAFGVAQQWVSDQGSHFKNKVMMDIQKQLGTNHLFATANSPWANGTVEVVCKQTIRAARAVLSEMHLAPQERPCVLPAIQAVLNNSPSSYRAGQTPPTAFTGHERDTPLSLTILHPISNHSLSLIKAQKLAESTKLANQVEKLHKKCQRTYQDSVASKWRPIMLTLISCSQISLLATLYSGLNRGAFSISLPSSRKGPIKSTRFSTIIPSASTA